MKTILKFLAIFFSSLILAGIFGYWFGKLNEVISTSILNIRPGFSTFLLTEKTGNWIDGILLSYPLFLALISTAVSYRWHDRFSPLLLGLVPVIPFFYFSSKAQNIISLLVIILGILFGLFILFTKKKLFAKNR